jgi:hypothetical protein
METWIALAITAVGTVGGTSLGAVIGLRGARGISREERAEQARAETLRAFTAYFSALVPVVAELRQLPPTPKSSPLADLVDHVRGEAATYIATRRRLQQLGGDGIREQAVGLAAASLDLRLRPLPPEVNEAIDDANNYVERLGQQRSDELVAEWPGIHKRLMAANDELRALSSEAHLVLTREVPCLATR